MSPDSWAWLIINLVLIAFLIHQVRGLFTLNEEWDRQISSFCRPREGEHGPDETT